MEEEQKDEDTDEYIVCPVCSAEVDWDRMFCPMCGSYMRLDSEEQNES